MVYGYGDSFQLDPGRLEAFIAESRALGKDIRAAAAKFESDLERTSIWAGYDDDFHDEVEPGDRRDVASLVQSYYAIADAFDGITEGRFLEMRKARKTVGENMESMDALKSQMNNIGEGSGGESTGGKH
ncbi:hypothetical protein [Streptomyces milbemycinicus]|uniref:hypothetical protein n=1 Tax=Streptomyces milbemycinicus TaxID=476552 RepID=UPI0033DC04B1